VLAVTIADLIEGTPLDEALDDAATMLVRHDGHEELLLALERARRLAARGIRTCEAVEQLGGGWVAEEALAIGLFAALMATDVADGLCPGIEGAVNHGGDSDSTGAIAGNLLGALGGVGALPQPWVERLELRRVITELADDLAGVVDGSLDPEAEETWRRYPGW
jgi:ADP-ribosyl-[dinitrogen reductase] hydrolase